MKKFILDLTVTENIRLNANYVLLKLTSQSLLPEMLPGQFAEIRVDGSPTTFLRRPISINFVDKQRNEVWFLIQLVGDGTRRLAEANSGDTINVVLPLGNAYTMPQEASDKLLLVGGGVGTAPMLYLGEQLAKKGHKPTFLLGARSDKDLLQLEEFAKYGEVYTTTEDGSHGEKGYVTQHSILNKVRFEQIYTCGPKPMMMAVAMVVTCAMIGANGLGMEVLIAINRTESGRGLIAGISIVIIAIIIDRLTQSLADKKKEGK